jgi:flagellar motor switch protein FliN/FliY
MMRKEDIKEFLSRMSEPDIIRKVEYPHFTAPPEGEKIKVSMNFIEEILVVVTAELGRATLKVRDILNLSEGSVVELEQPAGENAEVYVNEQKLGRGEIVVIGSNFGIRMESIRQIERKDIFGKA